MGGLAIAITEDLCIVSIVQIKSQLGTGLFISFVICDLIFPVLSLWSYTVCSDNEWPDQEGRAFRELSGSTLPRSHRTRAKLQYWKGYWTTAMIETLISQLMLCSTLKQLITTKREKIAIRFHDTWCEVFSSPFEHPQP